MAWAFRAENLPDNSCLLFEEVSQQKKQVKSALKNSSIFQSLTCRTLTALLHMA